MDIDKTQLKISVAEGERWRRTMNVTVPAGMVKAERLRIKGELGSRLKIPGFRKGRVPENVVEQRYGTALNQKALDKLIEVSYQEALRQNELKPISEGEVANVHYEPDEDLKFSISFDVKPEIEISRIGGFRIKRPDIDNLDDKIQDVLKRLQEQNGTWKDLRDSKPKDGNRVSVDIERLSNDNNEETQPYEFVLGKGEAIPDIEEAIKSLDTGTHGEFLVKFPKDFPKKERQGTEEHFRIHLNAINTLELPDINEDFARKIGEFEGLEDLSEKIKSDLQSEAENQAESVVRSKLLDAILEANPFTVPVSMVDRYITSLLGITEEGPSDEWQESIEKIRPQAELTVKRILVIDTVSDIQGFHATEEDIDYRIDEIAEKSGENRAKVYANLKKSERLGALEREIAEQKVFEFLKEQSEIIDN